MLGIELLKLPLPLQIQEQLLLVNCNLLSTENPTLYIKFKTNGLDTAHGSVAYRIRRVF